MTKLAFVLIAVVSIYASAKTHGDKSFGFFILAVVGIAGVCFA